MKCNLEVVGPQPQPPGGDEYMKNYGGISIKSEIYAGEGRKNVKDLSESQEVLTDGKIQMEAHLCKIPLDTRRWFDFILHAYWIRCVFHFQRMTEHSSTARRMLFTVGVWLRRDVLPERRRRRIKKKKTKYSPVGTHTSPRKRRFSSTYLIKCIFSDTRRVFLK